MQEDMNVIEKNRTWKLVDKPTNQKVIDLKWVYKTKFSLDCSINKLKARLVVKVYHQQSEVYFSYIFASIATHNTIMLLVVLA